MYGMRRHFALQRGYAAVVATSGRRARARVATKPLGDLMGDIFTLEMQHSRFFSYLAVSLKQMSE